MLTCEHRPILSSICTKGWTAVPTQSLSGMRSFCVSGTPAPRHQTNGHNVAHHFSSVPGMLLELFLTWAMSIQRWMTLALTCGLSCLCFSTVFTTQAAMALNWVMVARMVGALCLLSFLSLWDQMEPRQWWGTTFLNNSWKEKIQKLLLSMDGGAVSPAQK